MMSRVGSALCFLLSLVLCTASLDLNQVQVYPNSVGISEVFIVQLKNQPYSFNATTAIDVCTNLGVSIATRAQVETAQSNGLQTCRYGWVLEKIAVLPRTEKNANCGQNKVGTIVWSTPPSQLFDVFCFRSTDQTKATTSTTPTVTVVFDKRTDAKTTSPFFFLSTQLNKIFLHSSPSPQPISTGLNTSVKPTVLSFTVSPMTTKNSQTSPSISSSFSTSSTSTDLSTHLFTNSSPVTTLSNETDGQPPSGKGFSFGAVSMACVISVVVLLIMAGTGAVWYFKIKRPCHLSPWGRICHNAVSETEMWKHTEQQNFNLNIDNENYGIQMEDDRISF